MVTNEEWKEIEKRLQSFYDIVKLKIDGYEISILLKRTNQFKNELAVYVNGLIKGEWLIKECEESRRFYKKVTKSLMTQKQKKALQKLPKKEQKRLTSMLKLDRTYSYYLAGWTSFNSLKKHLIKENKSIELIS
jgi:hypothetical protein